MTLVFCPNDCGYFPDFCPKDLGYSHAGRDQDSIVVVDPHTDLVAGILEHVPSPC